MFGGSRAGAKGFVKRLRFALLMVTLAPVLLIGAGLRWLARRTNWRCDASVTVVFHKILCAALGVRVAVHGRLAGSATLIAANHVSWLDIPVLGSQLPLAFLAKSEVGRASLARGIAELQGVVFVDRRRSRRIPEVNRQIARTLRGGVSLVLFAEATTGDGNRMLRFRSSHFEGLRETLSSGTSRALVQPVHIAYRRRAGVPLGRVGQPLVAWYGDMTFADHLWRLLRDGPFDCEITFGEPIAFFRTSQRKEIALQAYASVRQLAADRRSAKLPGESGPVPAVAGQTRHSPGENCLIDCKSQRKSAQ